MAAMGVEEPVRPIVPDAIPDGMSVGVTVDRPEGVMDSAPPGALDDDTDGSSGCTQRKDQEEISKRLIGREQLRSRRSDARHGTNHARAAAAVAR